MDWNTGMDYGMDYGLQFNVLHVMSRAGWLYTYIHAHVCTVLVHVSAAGLVTVAS